MKVTPYAISTTVHNREGRASYVICPCGCVCHPEFKVASKAEAGRRWAGGEFRTCPYGWDREPSGADSYGNPYFAPCSFDPSPLTDVPLGMFHCPECGEMVVAGMPHPKYWEILDQISDYVAKHPEAGE